MRITSLKKVALMLVIVGLLFAAGGLFLTLIGRGDVHGFKYFGVVFSVMGIGFHVIDKNVTEIARELMETKNKENDE